MRKKDTGRWIKKYLFGLCVLLGVLLLIKGFALKMKQNLTNETKTNKVVSEFQIDPKLIIEPNSNAPLGWNKHEDTITDISEKQRTYSFLYPKNWVIKKNTASPSESTVVGYNSDNSVGISLSIAGWNGDGKANWNTSMDYDTIVGQQNGILINDPERIVRTKIGNYIVNSYPTLIYLEENKGSYLGDVYKFGIKVNDLLYQFEFSSVNKNNILHEREILSQIVGSFQQR